MSSNIVTAIYIAASVLFILSLGGLSNQESAKRAVWFGIVGMALAVFATIFGPQVTSYEWLIPMIAVGAVIGAVVAHRVEMTGMPQLVAALHSFVGLAAVFIGINSEEITYLPFDSIQHSLTFICSTHETAICFVVITFRKIIMITSKNLTSYIM